MLYQTPLATLQSRCSDAILKTEATQHELNFSRYANFLYLFIHSPNLLQSCTTNDSGTTFASERWPVFNAKKHAV
jgi:hypothetical protein